MELFEAIVTISEKEKYSIPVQVLIEKIGRIGLDVINITLINHHRYHEVVKLFQS